MNFVTTLQILVRNLQKKNPDPVNGHEYYLNQKQSFNSKSMFFTPTDPHEIMKTLNLLKPKKSCGYDDISVYFLKKIALEVIEPISIIINKSLNQGVVPDKLKIARVISIYKSKEKDKLTNYRPVSLLPAV